MKALKAGLFYFVLVFGAGFVFGTIRVLYVVPQLGVRAAELIEMPFMFVVTVLAARWLIRRLALPSTKSQRLWMGFSALALLLLAEFSLVWLRGLSLKQYFSSRDPISGTAYYMLLVLFALMPLLVERD